MDLSQIGYTLCMNLVLVTLLMIVSYFFYLVERKGAIFDIAWAGGFMITTIVSFLELDGYFWRKTLLFFLVILWSCRLGSVFFRRYLEKEEEGRFAAVRDYFHAPQEWKFFLLFLLQGVAIVVLSWPFQLIASNPSLTFSALEYWAILIWIIGYIGEIIADTQLREFKMEPANKNKVCTTGLWRFSRHPNYFFEWIIWIAFFLLAFDAPAGFTAIISPILMFWLLRKVSGIQAAEEIAVRTIGQEYVNYQKSTNAFFPWFPK